MKNLLTTEITSPVNGSSATRWKQFKSAPPWPGEKNRLPLARLVPWTYRLCLMCWLSSELITRRLDTALGGNSSLASRSPIRPCASVSPDWKMMEFMKKQLNYGTMNLMKVPAKFTYSGTSYLSIVAIEISPKWFKSKCRKTFYRGHQRWPLNLNYYNPENLETSMTIRQINR